MKDKMKLTKFGEIEIGKKFMRNGFKYLKTKLRHARHDGENVLKNSNCYYTLRDIVHYNFLHDGVPIYIETEKMKHKKLYWKEQVSAARIDIDVEPEEQLYYELFVIKKLFQDHTVHVIKHDTREVRCRGIDIAGYWTGRIYSMRGGKMVANHIARKIQKGEIR